MGHPTNLLSMWEGWILYLKTALWDAYKDLRGKREIHPRSRNQFVHEQHLPAPDCFIGTGSASRVNCINSQADWRKQLNKKSAYHIEMIIEIVL